MKETQKKNSSEVNYFVLYASLSKLGPVATIYNLLVQSNIIVHLMRIRMYSTYTAANSNEFSLLQYHTWLSDVFMYVFQVDDTLGIYAMI